MTTAPDFKQIATHLTAEGNVHSDEDSRLGLRAEIIDQLRQVWNARGAADLVVFDALSTLTRDHREIVREEFERDLRGLDQ